MSNYDVEKCFTQHSCNTKQQLFMTLLQVSAKSLAQEIIKICPDTRERSLALTKIEEAIFWANAAIAREKA